jgi:hypothetical protein
MNILSARDMFHMTDEAQLQVIWHAILGSYYGSEEDRPNIPGPMGLTGNYSVTFFFKATAPVIATLEAMGYSVTTTDPVSPDFMPYPNQVLIQNYTTIAGQTVVSWNVGAWPLSSWVSGSGENGPQYA